MPSPGDVADFLLGGTPGDVHDLFIVDVEPGDLVRAAAAMTAMSDSVRTNQVMAMRHERDGDIDRPELAVGGRVRVIRELRVCRLATPRSSTGCSTTTEAILSNASPESRDLIIVGFLEDLQTCP